MEFSIKDLYSIFDQIRSFLQIWLHLLKKSLLENLIFCAVWKATTTKFSTPFLMLVNGNTQTKCKVNFLFQSPNIGQNFKILEF